MLKVIVDDRAPLIGGDIKDVILSLKDINNFALCLQLDYHNHNTIFYLKNIAEIVFREDVLQIIEWNHSFIFLNYENILEYSVINAEEIVRIVKETKG